MNKTLKIKEASIRMSLIAVITFDYMTGVVIRLKGDSDNLMFNYDTEEDARKACEEAAESWNTYLNNKLGLL